MSEIRVNNIVAEGGTSAPTFDYGFQVPTGYGVTGAGGINITGIVTCGSITGDVTGNVSGSAATVTNAAQSSITSVGTLTTLQVDNININGNAITSTDTNGNIISWSSAGQKGFKGSRKSTPYAAQIAADDAATKAQEHGLKVLTVKLKGPGAGRETALRALQSRGFKILTIKDITPMPHNGSRPPKKRRV